MKIIKILFEEKKNHTGTHKIACSNYARSVYRGVTLPHKYSTAETIQRIWSLCFKLRTQAKQKMDNEYKKKVKSGQDGTIIWFSSSASS